MFENLEEKLKTSTLDELKSYYKIPKTQLLKVISERGLEVLYKRRTPVTNGLIPETDTMVAKYGKKTYRERVNKQMYNGLSERDWPNHEIKERLEYIAELDFRLGRDYAEICVITNRINSALSKKAFNKHIVDQLGLYTQTHDYCSFIEEDKYGIVPEPDLQKLGITDEFILGYLSERISPALLRNIKEELRGERK